MKKIIIPALSLVFLLSGCKGFLETDNIYNKDLDTFYSTPDEMESAVAGLYLPLYSGDMKSDEAIVANVFDDIMLGGGGAGGETSTYMDSFRANGIDYHAELWTDTYDGVYRANAIIERIQAEDFDLSSYYDTEAEYEEFVAQTLGEAYFMRAYYMFRAVRNFGGVPIIETTTSDRTVGRSTVDETYQKVISDFKLAIDAFPNKAATAYASSEYGHANKWIAEAYIARAFLYFTGYMTNVEGVSTSTVTLNEEAGGATLASSDIVTYLEDCMNNSGYALISDFRNLWAASHINYVSSTYGDAAGDNKLPWAKNNNLQWAGQDGFTSSMAGVTGNSEVMFSIRYAFGNWGWTNGQQYTNRVCLYFGPRDNNLEPFYKGWGMGTVHPKLYTDWSDDDPRKEGSILVAGDAENGMDGFEVQPCTQHTGYWNKKYQSYVINGTDYGQYGIFSYIYGVGTSYDYQLWHAQDFVLMRYADVLLMHSELTSTADGINAVRARSGLDAVSYSLDNLKTERLHELAFEALRWYDIVRWGDATSNSSSLYYGKEANVQTDGLETVYTMTCNAEQKGLWPIPETEIALSGGVYEQNPGW